jgi:GDPmannose 4,6-dehydratase
MRPVAIVTGATGQGGSYLCELLLEKGYHVKCLVRRSTYPIQASNLKPYLGEVSLYEGDVLDQSSIFSVLSDCGHFERIEVYNLAGQSHAGTSYNCPKFTFEVNTLSILNVLETIRQLGIQNKCRIYQASSSEMFGKVEEHPQNESTVFNPQTLYGVSKVAAHCLIKNYREMYGLYACSGILYNHESPRRSDKFVTQKIIQGLKSGKCFEIGNLESRRDWGHARDYVEAMWIALQQDKPDDYVVATGKTHSVREFIEIAVNKMNKTIIWSGENENEYGTIDGEVVVKVSRAFYRPYDVGLLVGDSSKIEKLGWSRKYDIDGLIEDMLKNTE